MPQIEIRYRRPPDRLDVFVQDLVVDQPDLKITLHDPSPLTSPLTVRDRVVSEPGAPIVWYVFPGAWYDIGGFYLMDGTFTGYYVNLITPPDLGERTWTLHDLCLDLWIDPSGDFVVLDQDEFDRAVDNDWIEAAVAERARCQLDQLSLQVAAGRFPPPVMRRYTLNVVRSLREKAAG